MPTTTDFFGAAEDTGNKLQEGDPLRAHFDRVLEARSRLQGTASKFNMDLNNLESVFAAFELAAIIGRESDPANDEEDSLISSFRKVIAETIEVRTKFRRDPDVGLLPDGTYAEFSDAVSGRGLRYYVLAGARH